MDKLGKILVPLSKQTIETNGTLTGDGTNTQLGLNYSAWKFNTDELLWSGGPQSSIKVNSPLNLYERVMFRLGHDGYGKQFEEYNTNTKRFHLNPLFAKNSANSEVWFEMNEWQYGDTKRDLVWQGHCYRRNLKAGGGVFEDLNTNVEGYEAEKYPISEVWGVNRIDFNTYNVYLNSTEGGSISSNKPSGYNGEICTIITTPETEDWKCSALNITGATLTGNDFMFVNSDVSANAEFEHNKTLTLINGEHGILSADKDKGFIGDVVTITGTMDEGWYLAGFNTTGATMTGNKFAFAGEDVTVEGLYTDEGFPVVYEAENGVHLTGDPIAIPGQGITLTTSYDTYYRTNGYDITGGYIEDGMLYATAPCTARLKSKLNTFTASGGWEKGSDVTVTSNRNWVSAVVPVKYATVSYHTSNVPTAWYATSNRWKPSNASAYNITLNPKVNVTGSLPSRPGNPGTCNGQAHFVTLLGSTRSNEVSTHYGNGTTPNYVYNKTITNTTTGIEYKISGCIGTNGHWQNSTTYKTGKMQYIAARTSGTWVATGIVP